ncbi:MAG: hypothetical protein GY898_24060 [Proteobacteria bacterium]|nr:hypothetical protein [Pseudomonadota bacterium]
MHYSTGYEAQATATLEAAETAWAVQVDQLGFTAPVLPDDAAGPDLDLYLAELDPWEDWAWAPDQEDHDPTGGRSAAAAYIAFDRDVPAEWLAPYVVHEFNHVLQYAYDVHEAAITPWEATAVAAQKWTLGDAASLWDADVPDFQAVPWAPVLVGDSYALADRYGIDGFYEYGAGLWIVALDEEFGDGQGSIGPLLWEATAQEGSVNEPDFVDAVAEVAGGLGPAMDAIARARIAWGDLPSNPGPPMITGQGFFQNGEAVDINAPDEEVSIVVEGGWMAVSHLGPTGWDGDDDPWVELDYDLILDDDVPIDDGPGGDSEEAACACATTDPASGWLLLPYLVLSAARRRHSRCSSRE